MVSIEKTIHHLIANGFNSKAEVDPYGGLVYTSFQERATAIAHKNIARLATEKGEAALAGICRRVSGDEVRHETFYQTMMDEVIKADPADAMISIKAMLKTMIVMPASRMTDGQDPKLFDHFATVAQRCGVYTVRDYSQIISHLIKTWDLTNVSVTFYNSTIPALDNYHAHRGIAMGVSEWAERKFPVQFQKVRRKFEQPLAELDKQIIALQEIDCTSKR
jgi:acyl-[acyl-carrier-protein] desaturase